MATPTILLTGATGFVGGATLARLMDLCPEYRILLLARDRRSESAADRLHRSLERFIGSERAATALRSCEIICGDLTNADSLSSSQFNEVTHVLHLASNTNLRSVGSVRHTNVLGSLTLAHRMRRVPGLQRFIYVGTSYICGESTERVVHEDMFPRPRARHFTEYTASKAECEMLLENTAQDLPLVVARPSVVVGHSRLGCLPSGSIFWFYRACDAIRRLTCPLESRDDVVPVDWVAESLVFLLFKRDLRYRRYHVSAGETSSVTWVDIADALGQYYGKRPEVPYQTVDISTIVKDRERIQLLLGDGDVAPILTVLPIFYRFMQIKTEVFENKRLLEEGMRPSPKFTTYLHQCATLPSDRSICQQMLDDV